MARLVLYCLHLILFNSATCASIDYPDCLIFAAGDVALDIIALFSLGSFLLFFLDGSLWILFIVCLLGRI